MDLNDLYMLNREMMLIKSHITCWWR